MRIIGGQARGRRLKTIKGVKTRPTLDRVKEALFNILGSVVVEARILDLFAGTGSLGLEALSRGAASVTFIEKNKKSIKVINENIQLCGFSDRAVLRNLDVYIFLQQTDDKFDLVLMDPPYNKGLAIRAIEIILKKALLVKEGMIVVEHSSIENPGDFPQLKVIRNRTYGDTGITIYQARGGK